jgi:hypothetical protein
VRTRRTLQHQALPAKTRYAIDTELWFRQLLADHAAHAGAPRRAPTKDELHDEAVSWFLERHGASAPEQYPARRASDEDVTFWVDSALIERVRELAARDGVKPARVLDAAFSAYVRVHVPEELIRFRQRVQEEARRLREQLGAHARRARRKGARGGAR